MSQWRENDKGSLSGSTFDSTPEVLDTLPIKGPTMLKPLMTLTGLLSMNRLSSR
jgi:hypothetical protein